MNILFFLFLFLRFSNNFSYISIIEFNKKEKKDHAQIKLDFDNQNIFYNNWDPIKELTKREYKLLEKTRMKVWGAREGYL